MNHPGFPPHGPEAAGALKERIACGLERSRRRVHALTTCDEEELLAQLLLAAHMGQVPH